MSQVTAVENVTLLFRFPSNEDEHAEIYLGRGEKPKGYALIGMPQHEAKRLMGLLAVEDEERVSRYGPTRE